MYRIMVVDDDIPFLRSLQEYCWERLNCRCVYAATNGREALDKCAQLMPHIVITDINMPLLDGIELTRELHERQPQVKVILLTVHQDFRYAREAVALGACDYLVKEPQYRDHLPQVIARAIDAFEDSREEQQNFLLHGGRLLILDHGVEAAYEALSLFLKQAGRQLMTVRLCPPYPDRAEVIKAIDRDLSPDLRWILYGRDGLELFGQEERALVKRLQLLKIPVACSCLGRMDSDSVADYQRVHEGNLSVLQTAFYEKCLAPLHQSAPSFLPLPAERSDLWCKQLVDVTQEGTEQSLEDWLHQRREECLQKRYQPMQVRSAVMQAVRQAQLYWAREMDVDIYEQLQDAPDLVSLWETAGVYVARLYRERSKLSYQCEKALQTMRAHLSDPGLNLNGVAEQACISPSYLSKRLKEETGMSFKEMLIHLRMERAAEQIVQGVTYCRRHLIQPLLDQMSAFFYERRHPHEGAHLYCPV